MKKLFINLSLLIFFVILLASWEKGWLQTNVLDSPNLPDVRKESQSVKIDTSLSSPTLPDVERKIVVPQQINLLDSPRLPDVRRGEVGYSGETPLDALNLPDIRRASIKPPEDYLLSSLTLPDVKRGSFSFPDKIPLDAPKLPDVGLNQVREFKDFRGGLDLVSAKTKVAPNCAVELENALWNPEGEMYKRPGYSEHSTPPEILNFLYAFYTQAGDEWTMGGSDTALYFWHEDSSDWTYLIGTEGTKGRWDGATFEDMFVATHEGIVPVVWDGSTMMEIGTAEDSLIVANTNTNTCILLDTNTCTACSVTVSFEGMGWDTNEWEGYILKYTRHRCDTSLYEDTRRVDIILGNNDHEIYIRASIFTFLGGFFDITGDTAWILSWFQDSLWREGTIDSVERISCHLLNIFDSTYVWDYTFNYESYMFEAVSGKGAGFRTFLRNAHTGWDSLAFQLPNFTRHCFDTTTHYKIYKRTFTGKGAKFVENFDASLWLGWTGTGDEQEKNVVIWSALDDLGNWPSGNYLVIESDDGDFITGMAKFPGEYTDVPRQEMIVTKNNSLYKIVPSGSAYNFWLIQSGVGCVSNSAISPAEGMLLFPDQHGVWAYDKHKPVSISALIDPVFEEWDTENLEDASAVYNPQDRHYYLSLPVDVDTAINANFITTFYRDSSGTDNQFVHLITTLGGEQNGDIEITDDTASQYCDIASDTLGNYCVLVNETLNLYLFRFDSLNARVGETIRVNDTINKVTGGEAHVDMNNNGRIVVVWEDFRDDSYPNGTYDIYGQCLRFSSGKAGNNFAVNSNWDGNVNGANQASVAINDDSVCVFAWQDWDDTTDFQTCIFAAIDTFPITTVANDYFKPFGGWYHDGESCVLNPIGPQGACANGWWHPDVDAGDTTFVIVCTDDPLESYGRYIVMNYSLDTLNGGITGQVEMNGSDHHSVSMNKKGRFIITWHHLKGLGDYEVYAIEYDIGGEFTNTYFRVDNAPTGISTMYPAVAINGEDQYCIVWWDERCDFANYYRCYIWEDGAVSGEALLNDICDLTNTYYYPEITATNIWLEIDTTKYTLAWNIDHHGWSKETFVASAYCYQHSIFDEVKILFANPEDTFVYNYGTQADDINDPVILTYQTPFSSFTSYPYFNNHIRFATIEAYLDTGRIYVDFYKDYSLLGSQDSIDCGNDCRQEIQVPNSLSGKNISLKITTGSDIDEFTLSKFWWEYGVNRERLEER